MSKSYLHAELTERIIKAFYKVYNTLGYGFLEKVYEKSLVIVLTEMGLKAEPQLGIKVYFEQHLVGEYSADVIVEDKVIVELKSAEALCDAHEAQLLNYLRATPIEVGLLLNFGPKPELRRRIFTNDRKKLATDDTDLTG